jgi:hypothetical protein
MSITEEEVKAKGELASACMLQQSMATVTGVAVGLALGLRAKSVKPFLVTSFAGTAADLGYGSMYACRDMIEAHSAAKKAWIEEKAKTAEATAAKSSSPLPSSGDKNKG